MPSPHQSPSPRHPASRRAPVPVPAALLALLLALLPWFPAPVAGALAAAAPAVPAQEAPAAAAPDGESTVTPPVAPRRPKTTEVHGVALVDPYHWLKDREDPATIAYLEAENAYTEARTAHLDELEETLYQEIKGRMQETDLSVPVRRGEWLYYQRTEEGRQYPVYARKRGEDGPEQVLLDVNEVAEGHDFFRVGAFEVSPDHSLLAWSFDTEGAEEFTLRVKDLETGERLPDAIPGVSWGATWGNDDRTLFYTTLDETRRPYRVHRHRLGTGPEADRVVFEEPDGAFFVRVGRTRDGEHLLITADSATTSEVHYLDADTPGGDFRVVMPRRHEVEYAVDHHGGWFYLTTNDATPEGERADNFQVVRAPAGPVTPGEWEVVIPHRERVKVEGVDLFRDHLVVREREDGLRRLRVRRMDGGGDHAIPFPEHPYAVWPTGNPEFDTDVYRFRYTSLVTPPTVYDYRMDEGTRELRKRMEVLGGYDPDDYETVRLYARADDGTAVPVDLVHRRGLERDGDNPTLLYGYGSYGASLDPSFSHARVSLLDRGFVFALAHPRGGGELGEAWHEGGRMLRKGNTFSDFIDVAEFLVEAGYTRPERLAIQGGSAGGLLMGAVVNQRPDLFAAVVANVPFVDVMNTMLDPSIPLTVTEYEEWGNPREEEYFHYMLSYSPYDNVKAQAYPAMLVTGGLNDSRVGYWEPSKWVAKLRTRDRGEGPILLKINMGAGHGGASGRYDAIREVALHQAFIVDQVGGDGAGTEEMGTARGEAKGAEPGEAGAPEAGGTGIPTLSAR